MLQTLQPSLEDFPLKLKSINVTCLTEIGKSENKNIYLKEQCILMNFNVLKIILKMHKKSRPDTHKRESTCGLVLYAR